MLKIFWVSSKVLISNLFFQTFCEYILRFSIIMPKHCSWLSKLSSFYFLRILSISLCATVYWINVYKRDIYLNLLSSLLCSLGIWMNKGIVCLTWFLILESLSWSLSYNTRQSNSSVLFYRIYYIWCILTLRFYIWKLYAPISNSSYIGIYLSSYSLHILL